MHTHTHTHTYNRKLRWFFVIYLFVFSIFFFLDSKSNKHMHKYMKHELVSPRKESRCVIRFVVGFDCLIFCFDVEQETMKLKKSTTIATMTTSTVVTVCMCMLNLLGKYCMRMSLEKMRDIKAFNCGEMWLTELKIKKEIKNIKKQNIRCMCFEYRNEK